MLRADVAKQTMEELGYSTPNGEVRALTDEETRNNMIIFPPAVAIDKGEFQKDVGDAMKLYNEYWEKLKAGQ